MSKTIAIVIATYGDLAWGTLAMKRAFASTKDQWMDEVILDHYEDLSLGAARNAAAERTDCDWLCFLDADDELEEGYIEAMRDVLPLDDRSILAPMVRSVPGTKPPIFPNRHVPITDLNHCVIGTLVPRSLFRAVGGFGEEKIYEDWALWLRCLRAGATIQYVEGAVYRAFSHAYGRNLADDAKVRQEWYWKIRDEHMAAT